MDKHIAGHEFKQAFSSTISPGSPGGEPPEIQQKVLHLLQSPTELKRKASALSRSSNDSIEIIDAGMSFLKTTQTPRNDVSRDETQLEHW